MVSYQYSSGGVEHHCAALWGGGVCVGRGDGGGTLVCGEGGGGKRVCNYGSIC